MDKIYEELRAVFERANTLQGKEKKALLRRLVADEWPDLPPWSTLDAPIIEEVQKANIGAGAVLCFHENGTDYAVLAEAGPHYKKDEPHYMIPGGFITLGLTPGSSLVAKNKNSPENQRQAVAREGEEEIVKDEHGTPLLQFNPDRFKPVDMDAFKTPNGEVNVVQGLYADLEEEEVKTLKAHIYRLNDDPDYLTRVREGTKNEETGLPEVANLIITPLENVINGHIKLLHQDQMSLFKLVHEEKLIKRRIGPTAPYKEKVKALNDLDQRVKSWRLENQSIGITSGVFDILHPGHVSFLEDAKNACSKLIVIIASDRTVGIQKGQERPFINELKRAQTIAGLECVDAVIISDEQYHEKIFAALQPDFMFKGHDYADKNIIGANMVGEVKIIPCAEDNFFSSTRLVEAIRDARKDTPPSWDSPII